MGQRLKTFSLIVALLTFSACTFYGEHPVKTFNDATGGDGLERSFWYDLQKQDWKDLEQHLAGNFVYVTRAGRRERGEALEQFRQMRVQEFSMGEVATEMNRDTFIVTYNLVLRGTSQGQALPNRPERRMSVWQQQKGGWVMIAHTDLGPIPE